MEIQTILWLDSGFLKEASMLIGIKRVIEDYCKKKKIALLIFGDPIDFIQESIALNKNGISYLVLTDVHMVQWLQNQVPIPKEVYQEVMSEQPRVFKEDFFGLYLCLAIYDFILVNKQQYKSCLRKPPIVTLSTCGDESVRDFQRRVLGDNFLKGIISKFAFHIDGLEKIIESL